MFWEVTVRDAGGFTFCFTYLARSKTEAVTVFKKSARRAGIRKFKNIQVVDVRRAK